MPLSQINHTGRRRLTSQDIVFGLFNESSPLAFEVSHLSLDRHNLPGDALVRLEAYQRTIYARFEIGTVRDFVLPRKRPLPQFNVPDGIRFRVKVTSNTEPQKGQLLAAGSGLSATWLDGGQESLLPVRPDDTLGQEVYRLSFDDGIVLLINGRIDQWREVSRDTMFMALVYPEALRTVLTRILLKPDDSGDNDDEEWSEQWIAFTTSHLKMDKPPQMESEGIESVRAWIDHAVGSFCRKNQSYNSFAKRWNREGGQ